MEKVAAIHGKGIVVADNDESKTGEIVAQRIGLPYFMPPDINCDFNDYHIKYGLFKASAALQRVLNDHGRKDLLRL